MLDGDAVEIQGVGFAGVKGFAGGFGRRALGPWGENVIKLFVQRGAGRGAQAGDRARAASRPSGGWRSCTTRQSRARWKASRSEIYPYLGSSRLEEPLGRYPVDVVFHGHAHHGTPEGRTMADVPVYNVSMALLLRVGAGGVPFKVVELPVTLVDGRQDRRGVQPDRRGVELPPVGEEGG